MPRHLHHLRGQDALRAVERRKRFGELRHVSADRRLPLDEQDVKTTLGDVERRLDPGNPPADDQAPVRVIDLYRLERVVATDLLHHRLGDPDRLLRRGLAILMHPATVLADVRHLAEERVQPRFLRHSPEGRLMHRRRTGRYHDPGQPVLDNGVGNELLPGIGAHVVVVRRIGDPRDLRERGGDRLRVDRPLDVEPAVTDEDPNPRTRHPTLLFLVRSRDRTPGRSDPWSSVAPSSRSPHASRPWRQPP